MRKDTTKSVSKQGKGKNPRLPAAPKEPQLNYDNTKRFQRYLELAPYSIIITDSKGRMVLVNSQTEKSFGYPRSELLNSPVEILLPENLRSAHKKHRKKYNSTPQLRPMGAGYELYGRRKDGSKFPVDISLSPVETDGELLTMSIVVDITERKAIQTALQENLDLLGKKTRYESIISAVTRSVHQSLDLTEVFNNAVESMSENIEGVGQIAILMVDGNDAVIRAQKGHPKWFLKKMSRIPKPKGLTWHTIQGGEPKYCRDVENDNVIGPAGRKLGAKSYLSMPLKSGGKSIGAILIYSSMKDAFDEDELRLLEIVARQIESAINNASQAEELSKARDELEARVEERTRELTKTNTVLETEIAERRQAEGALKESEERLRDLFDNASDLIQSVAPDGSFIFVNRAWRRTLGYKKDEISTLNLFDIIHPDSKNHCTETFGEVMVGKKAKKIEAEFITKKGKKLFVEGSASCKFVNGKPVSTRGVFHNITERKRAEEALKENLERYGILTENPFLLISEGTSSGHFAYLSPNHKDIMGYEPEELVGRNVFEYVHPDDLIYVMGIFQKAMTNLTADQGVYRYRHKNGQWRWLEAHGKGFKSASGEIRGVLIARDITERKEHEEEIKENIAQLSKKSRFEKIIRIVTQSVHQSINIDEVMENAVDAIINNISQSTQVAIIMVDGKDAVIKAERGHPKWFLKKLSKIPYPKGFTWKTIIDGKPMYVADVDKDKFIGPSGREIGTKSYLSMPIKREGESVGVITVNAAQKNAFDDEEISLLEIVAHQIGVAINNAQQAEALKEGLDQLSKKNRYETIISSITRIVHQSIDLQKVLENAVEAMHNNMESVSNVSIFVVEGTEAVLKALRGNYPDWYIERVSRIPSPKGVTWKVIKEGKPRFVQDVDKDKFIGPAGRKITKSYMSLPINVDGKTVGVININYPLKNAFDEEDIKQMETVVQQIEVAFKNAQQAEEILKTNELLAREISVRMETEKALEQSNAELEAFVYSVSHDLRAPLRAMQGFSAALVEDYGGKLDELGHNYASRILQASHRMENLIQDLLTYSRLTSNEIILKHVKLRDIVVNALLQLEADVKEKNASISVIEPIPSVIGHHVTLTQVVANLLTNAIKFVEQDVEPQVKVWGEEAGEMVRLVVQDNGIGISTEHRERIFSVFERLHGIETYPGTGIGLAIVKKGIERMGGSVGLESQVGKGSRFWFELPRYS